MADHSKPTTSSTYSNFVTELDGRFDDLALGLDPANVTATNVPTNAIRWNSANSYWEKYNGATWAALDTAYEITVAFTPSGNIVATTVQAAIAELDTEKAALASPALSGTPTAPTAAAGTNTTQIATTAFVQGELADYQPLDADLTALAALGSTGIAARTAADTWAQRTITGTTNQITVTNGNGVSGNPTLSTPQNIHSAAKPTFAGMTLSDSDISASLEITSVTGSVDINRWQLRLFDGTGTLRLHAVNDAGTGGGSVLDFTRSSNNLSQVQAPAGTVAAPIYSFTADPDTGLYRSSADQVTLATGGLASFNVNKARVVSVPTQTDGTNQSIWQVQSSYTTSAASGALWCTLWAPTLKGTATLVSANLYGHQLSGTFELTDAGSSISTLMALTASATLGAGNVANVDTLVTINATGVVNNGSGTITTYIAYNASDEGDATNVRAFQAQVSAGSNKWNLYCSGTAINYLNGALLIASTTDNGVDKLQVTGSAHATTALRVGTNPAAAGAVRLANAAWVAGRNAANGGDVNIARVDTNDRVQLGPGTVPVKVGIASSAVAAAAAEDAGIMIESGTGRLIYYSGGNRYYLAGTSF